MSRFVAVGDIHGCSQTLAKLLEILDLGTGDTLLSTGDLSSKGEDSQRRSYPATEPRRAWS